jgi:putative two-component system response regulator
MVREAGVAIQERISDVVEWEQAELNGHSARVSWITTMIARELGLDAAYIRHLQRAARLHDIGKIAVPEWILLKNGHLSAEEWAIMQTHTLVGAEILAEGRSPCIRMAEDVAHYHHERWDGLGYPSGLVGESIPLAARIVAVADVFDALVSHRPYKASWTIGEAIAAIAYAAGTQFDPQVVAAFLLLCRERPACIAGRCQHERCVTSC